MVNEAENGKEDMLQDLVSRITSFCVRLYGQRHCKRKTEKIVQALASSSKMIRSYRLGHGKNPGKQGQIKADAKSCRSLFWRNKHP